MVNPTITLVSTDTNSTYTTLEKCAYFVITTSNANGGSAGIVTNSITTTGNIIDEKIYSGDNNGVIIRSAIIDCVIGDTITTSESNTNCKHTSQIFKFSNKIYSVFTVDTQRGHDSTKTISTTGNVNTAYLVLSACSSYFADTTTSSYNAPLCDVIECPGNNDGYAKSFVRFFEPIQNNASLSVSSYAYNWSGILEVLYKINFVTSTVNPENSGTITNGGFSDDLNVIISATPKSGYAFDYCILNGYTRLDYIESNGNQYIDTDIIIPYAQTEIELDLSFTRQSGSHCIFGTSYQRSNGYMINYYNSSTDVWFYVGTSGNSVRTANVSATSNNTRHTAKLTNTGFYVNDTLAFTYDASGFTSKTPDTLKLFASGDTSPGSVNFKSTMKLYGGTIKNNGTLIRDYIPVIRHIDGAIGLLDLVEFKFYGNSGTGTFIGGDVYDS